MGARLITLYDGAYKLKRLGKGFYRIEVQKIQAKGYARAGYRKISGVWRILSGAPNCGGNITFQKVRK